MKKYIFLQALALTLVSVTNPGWAGDQEIEQLRQQLEELKLDYNRKLEVLEKRLQATEQASKQKVSAVPAEVTTTIDPANKNSFNPNISLILNGHYSHYSQDPEGYELPGYMLGGEAGSGVRGFALGHSELVMSANADDKFYGRFTLAFGIHDGETEAEIEEAFFETLGLDYGLAIRGGRFFSDIGYLNSQHEHQWDFVDAPLIYRGLFGYQLIDDGIQLSWLAPTDLYLSFGSELFRGSRFPLSAESGNSIGAYTLFAKTGGDIGGSNSWLAGVSYLDTEPADRSSSGHGHDHEEGHVPPAFSGDSKTWGIDFVWKWAPNGNRRQRNLQLQYEYYRRNDKGLLAAGEESGSYRGEQSGWYLQAVYQFVPRWRIGMRYDALDSSATGSNEQLIKEAGLDNEAYKPQRFSLMTDWSNSEFSRLRLQYNRDESSTVVDNQWILQFILSLGAHGAHNY